MDVKRYEELWYVSEVTWALDVCFFSDADIPL